MVTFLTLTRQFFLHTTPIDVINIWGISKMYATQIVKTVNELTPLYAFLVFGLFNVNIDTPMTFHQIDDFCCMLKVLSLIYITDIVHIIRIAK